MCASALRQLGLRATYFGAANERFGGCGSVLDVNERYVVSFGRFLRIIDMVIIFSTAALAQTIPRTPPRLVTFEKIAS